MDILKGKENMVWTFMGNTRIYQALRDYGDRISRIGLFSFKVRATGEIYESGVSIASGSTMRTYINKWLHMECAGSAPGPVSPTSKGVFFFV